MNTYPQLPYGPERGGFSPINTEGAVNGDVNKGKERTLLNIQHGIVLRACQFVAAVDHTNPLRLVFAEDINGKIARRAVLRFMGLIDIPEDAQYLQGLRRGQDELIRQRMDDYSASNSPSRAFKVAQEVLLNLRPFITTQTEPTETDQHGRLQLGNFMFYVNHLKADLRKDPTGILFMQTLRLEGLTSDQAEAGISLTAEMFTSAHTYFTDMELKEIVRARNYNAYYVNEQFLKRTDELIDSLTPPPFDFE